MPVVFVSHASADRLLVDEFVDTILRNGCGLDPKDIFYSSGADTGVADGNDLLAHVRHQVDGSGLVIAMLTPTFQNRPVCIAELGAAWATTGKLFPLLAPTMKRSELQGVLSTQRVEYMSDEGALDRLHSIVTEAIGSSVGAATWTRAKLRWLQRLKEIQNAGDIPVSRAISLTEYEALEKERDTLVEALGTAEDELHETREQLQRVSALKDADEVAETILPTDEVERFKHLLEEAREYLDDIENRYVAQAVVAGFSDLGGLPTPQDDWERRQVFDAADKGLLDAEDDLFWASPAFASHEKARVAVQKAIRAVDGRGEFALWFAQQYGTEPMMNNYTVLERVFFD